LRFFDLKRWGIEYKHVYNVHADETTLTVDDPRRAIEVPWEALSAGMASSRNATTAQSNANYVLIDTKEYKTK
jgi:hypothetical protein